MSVTYEKICEKLGFDPLHYNYEVPYNGHEDDSYENPFSRLTLEESDFLNEIFQQRGMFN